MNDGYKGLWLLVIAAAVVVVALLASGQLQVTWEPETPTPTAKATAPGGTWFEPFVGEDGTVWYRPVPATKAATPTATPAKATPTATNSSPCVVEDYVETVVMRGKTPAEAIAGLDHFFEMTNGSFGGQWSEPGFKIPARSVFWTDLFDSAQPEPIKVQGGWGVFYAPEEFVVPSPNGGGRYLLVCP